MIEISRINANSWRYLVQTLMSSSLKRFCALMILWMLPVSLQSCGGAADDVKNFIEGVKDLHGAIGIKKDDKGLITSNYIAPDEKSCGPNAPNPSCLTEADAAKSVLDRCPECQVVLAFKKTSDITYCASLAITISKLNFGVGTGGSVVAAQDAAIADCKAKETGVVTSACTLAKTRCL